MTSSVVNLTACSTAVPLFTDTLLLFLRTSRRTSFHISPDFEARGVHLCGLHGETLVRLTLLCTSCPEKLKAQEAGPQRQRGKVLCERVTHYILGN